MTLSKLSTMILKKEPCAMSNYALRLPESLKQAAKRIAAADDTTMNQFFEKRAALSTSELANAAWGKVGVKSAVAGDAWETPVASPGQ